MLSSQIMDPDFLLLNQRITGRISFGQGEHILGDQFVGFHDQSTRGPIDFPAESHTFADCSRIFAAFCWFITKLK